MTASAPRHHRYACLAAALAVPLLLLSLYAWRVNVARWEVEVVRFLQDAGGPALRQVSVALAVAGHGWVWVLLIGLLSVGLLIAGGVRLAVLLAVTATFQDVGSVLKLLIERARPSAEAVTVWREISSYSFPSGHTLGATLVFGFLFFALEHTRLPLPARRTAQIACVAWIVLMGAGRVVLGAHWPTDVLGAYLVGALLLLPVVFVLRRPAIASRLDVPLAEA